MKTILCLLAMAVCGPHLLADDQRPQKAEPKPQASARVEAIANTLTFSQRSQLLDLLNHGDDFVLLRVPGIGESRAAAIKKARPFGDVTDVVRIAGIGEGTFAEMVAHVRNGSPPKPKRPAPTKKAPPKSVPKQPRIAAWRGIPLRPAWTQDVRSSQIPLIHRDMAAFKS